MNVRSFVRGIPVVGVLSMHHEESEMAPWTD